MITKCLVGVVSVLFLLGLSTSSSADWETDLTGYTANNSTVGSYDIEKAKLEVYPDSTDLEEYLNVCLKMTNSLPGMILMEFDVDNDTSTGGSLGMPSIFNSCEGGTKIKPSTPGFDILIMLMLRDQDDDAGTAWCDGCYGFGGGQCFIKDTPCDSSCGTSDCYKALTPCSAGTPNCYLAQTQCQPTLPLCESCYEMTIPCGECPTEPCGIGRILGEWYADTLAGGIGGGAPADRGRIEMPLPKETGSSDEDCYKFPWKRIVELVYEKSGHDFDVEKAKDPANIKWQVSTWYDPDSVPPNANDFFDESQVLPCAEVTDIVPNDGKADVQTVPEQLCPVEEIYGKHSVKTELLRHLRDNALSKTPEGQEIIRLNYKWSPEIVKAMKEDEEFKKEVKEMIDRVLLMIGGKVE